MNNSTPHLVHTVGSIELSPDFSDMVMQASPSIAMFTACTMSDGKTNMRSGTSFCVDERGFFLTALHYVQGSSYSFILVGSDIIPMLLVAVDEELDLALFVVKSLDRKFIPLRLCSTAPEKSEIVVGAGFPAVGLTVALAAYVVGYQGQFVNGQDAEQPGIECPALPTAAWFIGGEVDLSGFSGGPMLNENGLVVAVTEMGDGDVFVAGTTAADALRFLGAKLR